MWTDEPARDAEEYDREMEHRRWRNRVGRCCVCEDPIYATEEYYDIDGEMLHDDCLREWAAEYKKGEGSL